LKTSNTVAADRGVQEFFLTENTFLKILLVLSGLYIAIFLRWYYLVAIFWVTLFWLLPGWKIIVNYLHILLKILPFIISYLILGLLFSISLPEQILLIGRITLMLLFSLFLIKTTTTERLLDETWRIRQRGLAKKIFAFSLATGLFVELFLKEIREARSKIKRISDVVDVIIDSFHNVYAESESVDKQVEHMLSREKSSVSEPDNFFSWANVYLMFLLALYTLILAL